MINFDFPKMAETYLHRIGRSGRFRIFITSDVWFRFSPLLSRMLFEQIFSRFLSQVRSPWSCDQLDHLWRSVRLAQAREMAFFMIYFDKPVVFASRSHFCLPGLNRSLAQRSDRYPGWVFSEHLQLNMMISKGYWSEFVCEFLLIITTRSISLRL